jgi:3-(3-hydroxy-phenyl)propionate hydroxylase
MTEHAVVIAGGGPTGLMLAAELALAGVAVVERRASQDLIGSRAGALHSRTIEVLDLRGIADRFLSQGQVAQVAGFAWIPLDISDFPTRHNYGLGLWQNHIERILAGWVGELRVPIYYGSEVTGIAQDDTGVDVEVSDGRSLRAEYLVGCDGGRSLIRKTAGIEFPGWGPTTSCLIAEGELAEEPAWGLRRDALGIHSLSRMGDGGPVRRCDILSRTHKGGSGWAATCWVSRRSTRRRSRSLAARARTWGSFRGSKASACRLAFA